VVAGSANDISAIDEYLTHWHETGRFNGVVLVAKDGETIFQKGYGLANREWGIPNTPDTRHKIHSISKQFTTVLVLQLAAEGVIELDGKLTDYLPSYRRDTGDRVTIDHLLRHTAGIPCYINDSDRRSEEQPVYEWRARYDRKQFVADFLSDDLMFEPGSEFKYSNTGYYLLALVVEAVTGKTYEENLHQRILEPLGMHNTGVDSDDRIIPRRASGYRKAPGGYINVEYDNPDNLIGAGNLYSTVGDLLVWNLALLTDRVLPAPWREKMFEVYSEEPGVAHAYSVNYFTYRGPSGEEVRFTGFSGGGPGFNTDAFRFLDSGVIVVIFDNSTQYNHWRMGPAINEILAGGTPPTPLPLLSDLLVETIAARGLAAARTQYADITANHRDDYDGGSLELEVSGHGRAALALHENDLAIEIFRLNVELDPNSWRVYRDLAEAYHAAGDAAEGERLSAMADEMRNRESAIMEYLRSGAYDEARRIIQRAHEIDPDVQLLTPSRIGPYFDETLMSGESEKALELCRIWALANPGTVGPYFSMARVYRSQGNIEQLRATYERILEIQPEGRSADAARRALAELSR